MKDPTRPELAWPASAGPCRRACTARVGGPEPQQRCSFPLCVVLHDLDGSSTVHDGVCSRCLGSDGSVHSMGWSDGWKHPPAWSAWFSLIRVWFSTQSRLIEGREGLYNQTGVKRATGFWFRYGSNGWTSGETLFIAEAIKTWIDEPARCENKKSDEGSLESS